MLSYPSGMTVSNRALIMLADLLRAHRTKLRTRWRRLDAGQQALLTMAHLRKGETYADLACGFRIGTSTVYRYLREALELLGRDGTHPDRSDRGRRGEGLRHPRRHPAAHRPGRHDRRPGPALLLSRHGARCRCCRRSVSPCRSPNPACDFHRTGLSTVSALRRG